jgi:hypothetical protein
MWVMHSIFCTGTSDNRAHFFYTLPISVDQPGYEGRSALDIHILQLNGRPLMPYHRYPNCSDRPTTGPATCLVPETLVAGERGFTQTFSEMGL